MLNPGELLIHDGTPMAQPDLHAGFKGLVPRNFSTHPVGFYAAAQAFNMPLIDPSEYPQRIADMQAAGRRLSDMRNIGMYGGRIPSRDQNGRGYCWFHSGTSAVLLVRARDNQPYADLSAYAGSCIIKNYRDEGGWGAQGVDWIRENGIPTSKFWPQQSVSRSNDTPEMRANAKLHRIEEGFWDLEAAQYDRKLSFNQMMTCLLLGIPVVTDFNWWGHSVCAADPVNGNNLYHMTRAESGKQATTAEFELMWGITNEVTTGYAIRIWNSWGDSWSEGGMGVLTGSKAIPNGAVAPRTVTASAA